MLFSMTLMQHSPKLITTPNIKLYQLKWFLSIFARPIKIHQFHIVSLYPWSLCQFLSVSIYWRLERLHFLRHERGWFEVWPLDLRSAPA
jgi:hypothetical protein